MRRYLRRGLSSSPASLSCGPSDGLKEQFHRDGFVILRDFLPSRAAARIQERVEPLFAGQFETGVFPDEWHWRKGLSRDDTTREMVNVWKCDRTIAQVVLSRALGKYLSSLLGWEGVRLAQDDLWWKPPGSGAVKMHQDAGYFDFLEPKHTLATLWIALEDTSEAAGTLQYIRGSHRWDSHSHGVLSDFFNPKDYMSDALQCAQRNGVSHPQVVSVEVPRGGAAIHVGRMWHGSSKNITKDVTRQSLAIHVIPSNSQFQREGVGYIYGRYKRFQSVEMDETFFPITYHKDSGADEDSPPYSSPFIQQHLGNDAEDPFEQAIIK